MVPFDHDVIEHRARELRSEEMRRIERLIAQRAGHYLRRLGTALLAVLGALSEALRPLFSWNPQAGGHSAGKSSRPPLLARIKRATHRALVWHPHHHHPHHHSP